MRLHTTLGAIAIALTFTGVAGAQSGNDDCTQPDAITGTGTFNLDCTLATDSGIAQGCSFYASLHADVWFAWTSNFDGLAEVATCNGVTYDSKIAVFPDTPGLCPAPNTEIVCNDDGGCGLQSLVTFTAVNGTTYLIGFGTYSPSTVPSPGTFTINNLTPPCVEDPLEENDTCVTASPVIAGSQFNLACYGDVTLRDDDWYSTTVAASDTLAVDLMFDHALGNIDVELYDACGGTLIASGLSTTDNESIAWPNVSASAVTVYWKVYGDAAQDCNLYDMTLGFIPPGPCFGVMDDVFEDNDDCLSAVPLPASPQTGLVIYGASNPGGVDGDFYTINVPPGQVLQVDILFIDANGDTDLFFYDLNGGFCGVGYDPATNLDYSYSTSDNESCTWNNTTGAAVDVIVDVEPWGTYDCNTYDLVWSMFPDPCLTAIDDTLEENDSCAAAGTMVAGTSAGLFVSQADPDWYTFSVPAGDVATFDAFFSHSLGDVDLNLYDDSGTCANNVGAGNTLTDNESVTWTNYSASAVNVALEVYVDAASSSGCNVYDLTIASVPDPCASGGDDSYEENDDCFTASSLPDGNYVGLQIHDNDDDFYSTTLQDGDTLDMTIYFSDALMDVDMTMYDVTGGCPGVYLDGSGSVSDNEDVHYTNLSGGPLDIVIRVYVFSQGTAACLTYDADIAGGDPGVLGTPFCFGDGSDGGLCPCGNIAGVGSGEGCLNGTGSGAFLTASGIPSVAADTLVLTVNQAVPSDFGIFVQNIGIRATPAPFYNGLFCLNADSHLVRHYAPPAVQPTVTDATGMGSNAQAMTAGDYLNDTQPGVTVYYQFWGRDNAGPCGAGANFSAGLYLVWLP